MPDSLCAFFICCLRRGIAPDKGGGGVSLVCFVNDDIKQLARSEKEHPVIIGNRVFDVLPTTQELVFFSRPKYLLLQLIRRGLSLTEASEKSGVELDEAEAFLASPKATDYLRKKELASIIAQEAKERDNWWTTVAQVMEGTKVLNKGQMVALQAQGDRVSPKKNDVDDKAKVVINFNFSPETVHEAFRRQEAIEAQLVKEQAG